MVHQSQFIEETQRWDNEGTIRDLIYNTIEKAGKKYKAESKIRYIDISSVDNGTNTVTGTTEYTFKDAPSRAQQCVRKGDILVSTVRPNLKNIAVNHLDGDDLVASSGFCVLRPKEGCTGLILAYILSDMFTEKMTLVAKGTNYPAIHDSDILDYKIRLSDKGSVSMIDNMFRQADKSKFAGLKSQFIEKIGDSRSNPKGWDIYTLRELVVPSCPISYGIVQPGEGIEEGGVPIVRPVDLDDTHRVTSKGLKRTTKEISDAYRRTILEGNELLLCVRGTTGLVGLATEELKGCNVTRGITPLSFNERVDRVFMLCMFLSDGIQEFISDNTIGSALRGINMAVIREMKFPVPPIDIQRSFASLYEQADKSKYLS